ncbi:MAG: B12-binding domain-containing radical SAM protein, partial [Nitrospirota bacterium]
MKREDLLNLVARPSRYIGGEVNSIRKDHERVRTKVALIFPDAYEIGISHLGLKILYEIINSRDDLLAERAYAPWLDMEELLRRHNIPLSSQESATPLSMFDILGFTIPYELTYTNILNILDLSGIPVRSEERGAAYPLIIGGGSAVFNPEPIADFFDAIVMGDGEEVVTEVIDCYQRWKEEKGKKDELLRLLSGIEGVYVPSL